MQLQKTIALALAGVGLASSAFAADEYRWVWDRDTGGVNMAGGVIKDVQSTFNLVTKRFTFVVNFDKNTQGQMTDGFWLAVSPGPNPKGHGGELALLYFDGSGDKAKLTAYAYNGFNGDTSYRDGSSAPGDQAPDRIKSSLLSESWINELSVKNEANGTRTMKIDIDATDIQDHAPQYPGPGGPSEWTGLAFGDKIGLWFHPNVGLKTKYEEGFLARDKGWQYAHQGWLDFSDKPTEAVPEPATLAALGLGLAAFARRKKQA